MNISTLFFDLDATLYPAENGLWQTIKDRIHRYMEEELGIPAHRVKELRQDYLNQYGTTLAGLRIHHQVNTPHYLDYVHNIPLDKFLVPEKTLRLLLESLPYPLWVFTNSDRPHAERVLKHLDVIDLFSGISDLYTMNFQTKPAPAAYQKTLALAGNPDPRTCILFDDRASNLLAAHTFGFTTALVGSPNIRPEIDHHLDRILDIPIKCPYLWTSLGEEPPQL